MLRFDRIIDDAVVSGCYWERLHEIFVLVDAFVESPECEACALGITGDPWGQLIIADTAWRQGRGPRPDRMVLVYRSGTPEYCEDVRDMLEDVLKAHPGYMPAEGKGERGAGRGCVVYIVVQVRNGAEDETVTVRRVANTNPNNS